MVYFVPGKTKKSLAKHFSPPANWAHTWDFLLEDGVSSGWTNYLVADTWIVGVGWQGSDPDNLDACYLKLIMGLPIEISEVQFYVNPTITASDGNARIGIVGDDTRYYFVQNSGQPNPIIVHPDETIDTLIVGCERGGASGLFLANIVKVVLKGVGSIDPFA